MGQLNCNNRTNMADETTTYKAAGVDIEAGEKPFIE